MLASSLVCTRGERAKLVEAVVAHGVEDVPQLVVVANPGVAAGAARTDEVHGVRSSEWQLARRRFDEMAAVVGGDELVVGGKATARLDVAFDCRVTSLEVVPSIERNIVGTARLIDLE